MKILRLMIGLIILLAFFIGISCGDDKKVTNPVETTPASLVGTWWYDSGTVDDVPIASFAQISFTDTSEAGFVTFGANRVWNAGETYDTQTVFTQSGTLTTKADTLTITRLVLNGNPAEPHDTSSSLWHVSGDTLRLTDEIIVGPETLVMIAYYLKE